MIMERLIFPSIDELHELLSTESLSSEAVGPRRVRSLVTANGLMETAKTVGIVLEATAQADEAGDNVVTGAQKLTEAAIAIGHIVMRLIAHIRP